MSVSLLQYLDKLLQDTKSYDTKLIWKAVKAESTKSIDKHIYDRLGDACATLVSIIEVILNNPDLLEDYMPILKPLLFSARVIAMSEDDLSIMAPVEESMKELMDEHGPGRENCIYDRQLSLDFGESINESSDFT